MISVYRRTFIGAVTASVCLMFAISAHGQCANGRCSKPVAAPVVSAPVQVATPQNFTPTVNVPTIQSNVTHYAPVQYGTPVVANQVVYSNSMNCGNIVHINSGQFHQSCSGTVIYSHPVRTYSQPVYHYVGTCSGGF